MTSFSTATFGGGCFWCTEAVFQQVQGVHSVKSGYSGGHDPAPNYQSVCQGKTGHAEAVQIKFDPEIVDYADLLHIFFSTHDPTTLNRQGADVGTQYRSVIFYHDDQQKHVAEQMIQQLNASGAFQSPIVTELAPFGAFYPAEDYHDNYFASHSSQPYCQVVIRPKLEKFRKQFEERIKDA